MDKLAGNDLRITETPLSFLKHLKGDKFMRIYEISKTKSGKIIGYARSFDQAKAVVKEDDPSARKTNESIYSVNRPLNSVNSGDTFSNGMAIILIDIKADKEGVITLLNSILSQPEPEPEPVEKPTEQVVAETARAVTPTPERPAGIIPATAYDGTGNGTCLHCNKQVGYVGGFPRVNPPEEIRDK